MMALAGAGILIGIPYLLFAASQVCQKQTIEVYLWLRTLI